MKPPWWRTAGTLLVFGLMIVALFLLVDRAARPGIVPVICGALVTLGLAAAGHSAFQHHVEAGK